jgi:FMN-dependent NADH-azoreductase
LTANLVAAWTRENPEGEVIRRDLAATSIPPITDEWLQAAYQSADKRTEEQCQTLWLSEILIDELLAADLIVIGAPMYNYAISAPLKGWIDQIVRPGRTVVYGPSGPKGLLTGKKVIVLTARGGAYSNGSSRASYDHQQPYLRLILAYIGLTDVTFIHAENQQRPAQAQQSREAALRQIEQLVTSTIQVSSTAGT